MRKIQLRAYSGESFPVLVELAVLTLLLLLSSPIAHAREDAVAAKPRAISFQRFSVEEVFGNYDVSDGLGGNEFTISSYSQSEDGTMYFGGPHGFTTFTPGEIRNDPYIPPVVLTDFQLSYRSVALGPDSLLKAPIWETDILELSYKDDIITFEFAALSYVSPRKNLYRFRLLGLEEEWNEVDSSWRFASYTSLRSGSYSFQARGSNGDGIWNENGVTLRIRISPPWW